MTQRQSGPVGAKLSAAAQERLARAALIERGVTRVLTAAIHGAVWAFLIWQGSDAIKMATQALAGKQTTANIALSAEGKWNVPDAPALPDALDQWCWWFGVLGTAFGVTGLAFGYNQRQLKRHNVKRMGARLVELETRLDPGRTTSNLTCSGDTNPEDR